MEKTTNFVRCKKDRDHPFCQISNQLLRRKDLSLQARGLLVEILSFPDDWQISIKKMYEGAVSKKYTYYAALKELEQLGFISKKRIQSPNGKFVGWQYEVDEMATYSHSPYLADFSPSTDIQDSVPPESTEFRFTEFGETEMYTNTDLNILGNEELIPSLNKYMSRIDEPRNTSLTTKQAANVHKLVDNVKEIFEHWQVVMGKPKTKLDAARNRAIQKSLKSYTVDQIKAAIVGCSKTPWYMGDNEEGRKHNDLDVILRNAKNTEMFMEHAVNPPKPKVRQIRASMRDEEKQAQEATKEMIAARKRRTWHNQGVTAPLGLSQEGTYDEYL